MIKSFIGHLKIRFIDYIAPDFHKSYSQSGEDLIIEFLALHELGLSKISFLDIGTNDPIDLNNTYLFYTQGQTGVCIEANPVLAAKIKQVRPKDNVLNIGVGPIAGEMNFYTISPHTLSSFSKVEAQRYEKQGYPIVGESQVNVRRLNEIIEEYFETAPDLLSLDVEGLDFAILQDLDFARHRPKILCIETLTFDSKQSQRKITEINDLLEKNGYMIYADTHINTIFVDQSIWNSRRK